MILPGKGVLGGPFFPFCVGKGAGYSFKRIKPKEKEIMKRIGLSIILMLALMFVFNAESHAAKCSQKQTKGIWSFYMSGSDVTYGSWYVVCDVQLDSFGYVIVGSCFDSWDNYTEDIEGVLWVEPNCTASGQLDLYYPSGDASYYIDFASASKTTSLGVGEDDLKLRFSFSGQKR